MDSMERLKQTVFGRDPARVRHRLRVITLTLWGGIVLFNIACTLAFGTHILAMLGYYFAALACYYTWHWCAHQKWTLRDMYRVHMYHHHVQFPLRKFLWRTYDIANPARTLKTSLAHDGTLVAALAVVMACSRVFFHAQTATIVMAILFYCFLGFLGIYLHDAAHIDGHWLERYLWFHDLRALHYRHHMGSTKTNYGFLDFAADALMDTAAEGAYVLDNSRVGILNHTPHSVEQLKALVEWQTGAQVVRTRDGTGEVLQPIDQPDQPLRPGQTIEFELRTSDAVTTATTAATVASARATSPTAPAAVDDADMQRDKAMAATVDAEVRARMGTPASPTNAAKPPSLQRTTTLKLKITDKPRAVAAAEAEADGKAPEQPAAASGSGSGSGASGGGDGVPRLRRQLSSVRQRERGVEVPDVHSAPASSLGADIFVEHDLDEHAIHYDGLGYVLSGLLSLVGLY